MSQWLMTDMDVPQCTNGVITHSVSSTGDPQSDGSLNYATSIKIRHYLQIYNGLDLQSRRSKSCVVNDGSLSTKVLRVVIGYRRTRSMLFRFLVGSKRMTWEPHRRVRQGSRHTNNRVHFSQYVPTVWSQPHRVMLQVLHLNRLWPLHLNIPDYLRENFGYRLWWLYTSVFLEFASWT
jgi:hypothetical protein